MDDDAEQWHWRWTHYAAIGIGTLLWIALWYLMGVIIQFALDVWRYFR